VLAPSSRRIFATWDLPGAAGRAGWLEAVVPVSPVDRGMSTPAPLQPTGLLFSATGSPAPPPLRRAAKERPRPPGLKFKLLIKRVGKRGENTQSTLFFLPLFISFFFF